MITMFNYKKSDEELFNDIIDGAVESVRQYSVGIADRKAYEELQANLNANVAKYCVSGTRYEAAFAKDGGAVFNNPNVIRNKTVKENFDAVIAQVINAALPMTTSDKYGETFMDIHQIGWGDTARFLISSNDLFKVNEVAEGIHRGILQPIYNNEVTVNCGTIEIATSIDWYPVAAGVFDWGNFGARAGRSFEGYIMGKAIAAMTSATAAQGAAYSAAGFSNAQWTTLAQRVAAANGGAQVYAVGTLAALGNVIPTQQGLQYGLGEEVAKKGFLDKYLGVTLAPIDQAMVPGTVNSTATLMIPDDKIYLVASEAYKPVKVVFEGDSVVVEEIAERTTDKTYWIDVQMKIGVAAVVGSKFGTITIGG